eukprot:2917507-Pyramimonas_sp.AAC.1
MLFLCETWGLWPQLSSRVHIVLLSKPSGGHRPIALLTSIYRAWAKARVDFVRKWACQLNRPWIALGAQKSTTDVAA